MIEDIDSIKIQEYEIDDKTRIVILNIEDIEEKFEIVIDKYIMKIWQGDTGLCENLAEVKSEVLKFVYKEETGKIEIGAIAEFFVHIYLNDIGFEQKCLFQNLEDSTYKKGFDGYYNYNNNSWIMESKSTEQESKHNQLVDSAYKDIKSKINDFDRNNPWKNAYFHASAVGSENNILEIIKKYSNDFKNKKTHKLGEFNIIPASTIYYDDLEKKENEPRTFAIVEELISKYEYKNINVICINNSSVNKFLEYLKREK